MRKLKVVSYFAVMLALSAFLFGGCTYGPARRYMQTEPNNAALPHTPAIPNNVVGSSNTNRISATYEVVDYSYLTITTDSVNVRLGAGTNYPSIGIVRSGQKIRALGKLDGWYIIKMPNSSRIGCIPARYATPSGGTQTGAVNPSVPAPNPAAPAPAQTQSPGATGATGTTGAAGKPGNAGTTTGTTAMSSDESRILQLVNAERQKAGVSPLKSDGNLVSIARAKSQDMVDNNYFSHQSPTYGSPFDMLKSAGISYMYAGENIAINQSADGAMKAWMNSEGHRKNILNPNFTDLGVGIAPKGDGSYVYTQEFIGR